MKHSEARGAAGSLALAGLWLLVGAGCASLPSPPPARTAVERRGRHVLRIATGCGCHGANFAGWRQGGPDRLPEAAPYGERFVGPDGVVPAPNITPDPDTGIGGWSDDEITQALRNGIRPNGEQLSALMPFRAYHGMAESDLAALVAYLHRLRPVRNQVPARQLSQPLTEPGPGREEQGAPAPAQPPENGIALGRYLVQHVCTCTDCHLPRGAADPDRLIGQRLPVGPGRSVPVPDITPDRETGIGRWSESAIARYLRTGSRPDGGLAQSLMAGLILTSYEHLTRDEARAIATYLKSIPPARRPSSSPASQAGGSRHLPEERARGG